MDHLGAKVDNLYVFYREIGRKVDHFGRPGTRVLVMWTRTVTWSAWIRGLGVHMRKSTVFLRVNHTCHEVRGPVKIGRKVDQFGPKLAICTCFAV